MSTVTNAIMADANPLAKLLDSHRTAHVGYVYGMSFTDALVLTNDAWKERVGGIPHNSFLIAAGFDPENMTHAHEFDREIVLLRVLEPVVLPSDRDLLRTVIEHNQRRTEEEVFGTDLHDGHDPVTHNELQFGGIRCRILGTFFNDNGELRLGSDVENYMSCTRLRAFKPSAKALETIINHVNPEISAKARDEAKKSRLQPNAPAFGDWNDSLHLNRSTASRSRSIPSTRPCSAVRLLCAPHGCTWNDPHW